jgi:nicotinamidase-related amidase
MPHLTANECVLVVIDAQPGFYAGDRRDVDIAHKQSALDRAAWVCGVASALVIPIVVTEEDPSTNGPTDPEIQRHLPVDCPVLPKTTFGANDNPSIDSVVRSHDRATVVLVGMETDVCVAHSALGWRENGLRVVVVHDAVYSAGHGHDNGIARLGREGVELLSAKELYYEWLRTLAGVRAFDAAHPDLATPPGFSL